MGEFVGDREGDGSLRSRLYPAIYFGFEALMKKSLGTIMSYIEMVS